MAETTRETATLLRVPDVEDDDEVEEASGRKMDKELRRIGQIMRLLDELEESACARVVAYLSARYYPERKP